MERNGMEIDCTGIIGYGNPIPGHLQCRVDTRPFLKPNATTNYCTHPTHPRLSARLGNSGIFKNKGTSLWKFRHDISIVETFYWLHSSTKVDAQSLINWTVVGHQVDNTSELRRLTTVVYRSDRRALSTARFGRAGQLATADTCPRTDERSIGLSWHMYSYVKYINIDYNNKYNILSTHVRCPNNWVKAVTDIV